MVPQPLIVSPVSDTKWSKYIVFVRRVPIKPLSHYGPRQCIREWTCSFSNALTRAFFYI